MTGEDRRVISLAAAEKLSPYGIEQLIMYADAIERWLKDGGTLQLVRYGK